MAMFTIQTQGQLSPHDQQEWVLTNGLGGYASSTVVGMNMRRYHGLLCAATAPPVGRVMTVNRIGEVLTVDDRPDRLLEFSINAFRGQLHPRGDRYLQRFELDQTARWEYLIGDVRITKELRLERLKNVAHVQYTVDSGSHPFRLNLLPMISLRDFHALRRADFAAFRLDVNGRQIIVGEGAFQVGIAADAGAFEPRPDWWYAHLYPMETERGQDDSEDLYTPGRFVLEGRGAGQITLTIEMQPAGDENWQGDDLPQPQADSESRVIQKLSRAAEDFIVRRKCPDGSPGATVIAGYPWFADWGRDTMISLPGLMLARGKFQQAAQVLGVFARYVSQGMIPNRFDDYTNQPSYNTVDASLWFIHAAFEYQRLSHDTPTFVKVLLPACRDIIDGYRNGTRFDIKMDPADGLINQGNAQTQLTWMDAKCNGVAFTPRQGKPVEINALWYHALKLMEQADLAARVAESFRRAFWISPYRGLADVVEGNRRDESTRPNQIFAASLPNSPLLPAQQAAVVEVVRRELLTPFGLRTLSRSNPNYKGKYTGPQMQRDAAYHNGTVWPWLIGPFLEAYLRANAHSTAAMEQARQWLSPLLAHLSDQGAIGQIAEIFDGDEPHRPVGCPAQAWSVGEVLRLAAELRM